MQFLAKSHYKWLYVSKSGLSINTKRSAILTAIWVKLPLKRIRLQLIPFYVRAIANFNFTFLFENMNVNVQITPAEKYRKEKP
jgi:hypothetical protein